jgi:hypothetical protein
MNRITVGIPSNGQLQYTILTPLNGSGTYEIVTQTESEDASGNKYSGPAPLTNGTDTPKFTTAVCALCVDILYQNYQSASYPAVTGMMPITVTGSSLLGNISTDTNPLLVQVQQPQLSTLPPDNGYFHLSTFQGTNAISFLINDVPLTAGPTWTYLAANPPVFNLYFTYVDLTTAAAMTGAQVSPSSLTVRGYNNGWSQVTGASIPLDDQGTTNEAFVFTPPNGLPADQYYVIAFPYNLTYTGQTPAVTPMVTWANTRAFNPNASNPIYQQAVFYYSYIQPASMEARIYDTAGRLVRDLTIANGGIQPNLFATQYGTVQYYFTWNGTNDAGVQVRNGLYLVRWNETGIDGSTSAQTKPVALIK